MSLFICNVCGVDATLRCEGVWCNAMMCEEHSRTHRYQTLCLDCASDQEEMEEDLQQEASRARQKVSQLDWCGHPECRVWGGHLCKEAF